MSESQFTVQVSDVAIDDGIEDEGNIGAADTDENTDTTVPQTTDTTPAENKDNGTMGVILITASVTAVVVAILFLALVLIAKKNKKI